MTAESIESSLLYLKYDTSSKRTVHIDDVFYKKYVMYKKKYIELKKAMKGGSITLPNLLIKGPVYLGHLNFSDKNIYLLGEAHIKTQDITCGDSETPTVFEWIQNDIIPKYTGANMLDIFIEQPYFYKSGSKEFKECIIARRNKDSMLPKMLELINNPSKNLRVHTIDIRNELSMIFGRLAHIESIITKFLDIPNLKIYIIKNHNILLNCLDVTINWFTFIFLKPGENIIIKKELTDHITKKLIPYINGLEGIMINEEIYKIHKHFIDIDIKTMKEQIEELLGDIDFIPDTKFENSNDNEHVLNNKLFHKIYEKIDSQYKLKFSELNQELIKILTLFVKKYNNFKKSFNPNTRNYRTININEILQYFENTHDIPDFNNIMECCEIAISVLALFMDLYVIGRLLKPYVKNCFIYTGHSHTKNIYNKLKQIGFNIMNETDNINRLAWENMGDTFKHCIQIKDLELHIN